MSYQESLEHNLATLADLNRGRLVIVGLSEEGNWRLFTGMGGRSPESKNRYYQQLPDLNGHGDYIRTTVHDPLLQQGDPQATLYIAQRGRDGWYVASNGEQTEGISIALALGKNFMDGQYLYGNEGKDNGYTSRISAAVRPDRHTAIMGKIVRQKLNPIDSFYKCYSIGKESLPDLESGEAYIIYTYDGKGGLEPDEECPRKILLPGTLEESMDLIWNKWDPKTKAGLVGKEIERGSDRFKYSFRSIHPGRA